jgi:hypothetical protein
LNEGILVVLYTENRSTSYLVLAILAVIWVKAKLSKKSQITIHEQARPSLGIRIYLDFTASWFRIQFVCTHNS